MAENADRNLICVIPLWAQVPCGHNFCMGCISRYLWGAPKCCPTCRTPISQQVKQQPRTCNLLKATEAYCKAAKMWEKNPKRVPKTLLKGRTGKACCNSQERKKYMPQRSKAVWLDGWPNDIPHKRTALNCSPFSVLPCRVHVQGMQTASLQPRSHAMRARQMLRVHRRTHGRYRKAHREENRGMEVPTHKSTKQEVP